MMRKVLQRMVGFYHAFSFFFFFVIFFSTWKKKSYMGCFCNFSLKGTNNILTYNFFLKGVG